MDALLVSALQKAYQNQSYFILILASQVAPSTVPLSDSCAVILDIRLSSIYGNVENTASLVCFSVICNCRLCFKTCCLVSAVRWSMNFADHILHWCAADYKVVFTSLS